MENSDFELKGRRLKREETLLLLASALMFEEFMEERYCKNGTFTLTQHEKEGALFIFGRKMMGLYASGSLERTVAESVIAKERSIIAAMKVAGVDMDEILKFCEPEDESYNKEEEYGDDNQH